MAHEDGEGESRVRWAGFSDYEDVAAQLHQDINHAVDAYAELNSRSRQGLGLTPKTAVNTRKAILKITKRLQKEVARNKHAPPFDEIHERWSGEDGYVAKLERADFRSGGVPPWLGKLVDDIVEAGWELGYLKAGIERSADPDEDLEQAKAMFKAGGDDG